MAIKTYPEMNERIKALLEMSDEPMCHYAAQRIRELEEIYQAAKEIDEACLCVMKGDSYRELDNLREILEKY